MLAQRGAVRKANLVRRGRASVLWSLFFFLALQAAFHYPLSEWWPQLRDVEYANKLIALRAHVAGKTAQQPLIVAFGSSLTAMGVNPEALTKCQPKVPNGPIVYNFAINSHGPMVQLMCLRRLIAEGIRPDWILVETMPFFLFESVNRIHEGEFIEAHRMQIQDLSVLAHYKGGAHKLRMQWRRTQACPWYTYRLNIQNWLLGDWVPAKSKRMHLWTNTDSWGWEAIPFFVDEFKGFKISEHPEYVGAYMNDCNRGQFSENMHEALREMTAICKKEKIGMIMVRMPESTWIRNSYSPAFRAQLTPYFEDLRKETGALTLDASGWLEDGDFVEGWHASPSGAVVFTRRLERELLQFLAARERGSSNSRCAGHDNSNAPTSQMADGR